MIYLKSYTLPTLEEEEDHAERYWGHGNPHPGAYPYGIFPFKGLRRIEFSEVTVFCGGNGSGKSTLLNLIAESLNLPRITPFNTSEFFRLPPGGMFKCVNDEEEIERPAGGKFRDGGPESGGGGVLSG